MAVADSGSEASAVRYLRWAAAGLVPFLVLAACSAQGPEPQVSEGTGSSGASALRDGADDPDLPTPLVDVGRIIDGGPPPDGIPPIHDPQFQSVDKVDWLADAEPVIVLRKGDHARVYPVQIMVWHEIVNDRFDGEAVTTTYCPLCNTAIAFRGLVEGQELTFGTSGKLYKSALVMYDRQTESLWSQVERRAIAGELTGTRLETLPASMLTWADVRDQLPDAQVLVRPGESDRPYGSNPYEGYDTGEWNLLDEPVDEQLPAKERVVHLLDEEIAVRSAELAELGVAQVDGQRGAFVLLAAPGLASALDDRDIAEGRPVPATGVFSRNLDGRQLDFRPVKRDGAGIIARDTGTGSGWTLLGNAVDGPLAGRRLVQVPAVDTFWFAAKAFQPELTVTDLQSDEPGGKAS